LSHPNRGRDADCSVARESDRNLTNPELHKRVWDAMAGPTGYFTIAPDERSDCAQTIPTHFHSLQLIATRTRSKTPSTSTAVANFR
jgi:hypothetical protein